MVRTKQTIYGNITYKELLALRKKIKDSKIIQISYYDGWRYALCDKRRRIYDLKHINF